MSPEPTYWLIETQSEGVRRFHGAADESALQRACRYASTAPSPMLRIQERRSGDGPEDPPLRRLDWQELEGLCGAYWD
jgi:hypothetical protein